jgi:cardiolipin synthase (CMP-forming)
LNNAADARPPAKPSVWTVPNALSLLRLASVPAFVWLFATGREKAAVVLFIVGGWTDFFDGYIARRTGAITELGKLLDPLADRVCIVALALALLITDALPVWLVAIVIARDVAVFIAWPILERRGFARIPVNFVGKCATAALLFGLGWSAWSQTSWPAAGFADEVGFGFVVLGAVLYWVAAVLYVRVLLATASGAGGPA